MRSAVFTCSPAGRSLISGLLLFSSLVTPALAANFDANAFFEYVDRSCTSRIADVNIAGDDMNALVEAAEKSLAAMTNGDGVNEVTFDAYFGKANPTVPRTENAETVGKKYSRLGANIPPKTLSLYCDGSAMTFVTTKQEGPQKGQPFTDAKGGPEEGRWHIPADRRPPNTGALYIKGVQRPDFCKLRGKDVGGLSVPGEPLVVLCPGAFTQTSFKTLQGKETEVQPVGTTMDRLQTPGTTLLHETTHAVLGTSATEKYGFLDCKSLAGQGGGGIKALRNADNYIYYAMASFLTKNDWRHGFVTKPRPTPVPAEGSTSTPAQPPPLPSRLLRRLLDAILVPRRFSLGGVAKKPSFKLPSAAPAAKKPPPAAPPAKQPPPSKPAQAAAPPTKSNPPPPAKASSEAAPPPAKASSEAAPPPAKASSEAAPPAKASSKAAPPPAKASSKAAPPPASTKAAPPPSASTASTKPSASALSSKPPTSTLNSSSAITSSHPTSTSSLSDVVGTEAINIYTTPPVLDAAAIASDDAALATMYGSTSGATSSAAGGSTAAPTTLVRVVKRS